MMDLAYYLRGYGLSANAMLIYGVLDSLSRISASNGKTYCYISRKSLGERIGKSERTARKAVKELIDAKLVVVKRIGLGRNDHIYVNAPNADEGEKECMKKSLRPVNNDTPRASVPERQLLTAPLINTDSFNSSIDMSINPHMEEDRGQTAKKDRPTPKRLRKNIDEQRRIRTKYKELLRERLNVKALEEDMIFTPREDVAAVNSAIDLIANAMASKAKIYINGALLTAYQWFSVVKEITLDGLMRLINRMTLAKGVKNPRAYFLSSLYNEVVMEKMERPFFLANVY